MHPFISILIPAYNEEDHIVITLQALRQCPLFSQHAVELLVIDDGSSDRTASKAWQEADEVVQLPFNQGKGGALMVGARQARGDIFVFLDADLGASAVHVGPLVEPIINSNADLTIAKFPPSMTKGGFGLVKALASKGIYKLSGFKSTAPLSGQRAFHRKVWEGIDSLADGFGLEVGFTIDVAKQGFRIKEVELPLTHRETGRDWAGFMHRGKQFLAVGRTLIDKWRNPIC